MIKKLQSIIHNLYSWTLAAAILIIWQALCSFGIVPGYLLPSPVDVVKAFIDNFGILMGHAGTTLLEACIGLVLSVILGFAVSVVMDRFFFVHKALYPIMVITQTIPTIAIAPLLVVWMGYGIAPKITLIVIVCFFPIAMGMLGGFSLADPDTISLMRAMGANESQIFRHVKLPSSVSGFFSGLKISVSYAIVGAVISEWLGGNEGLGVYMTRVRKSYAYDKMFAVIFLIIIASLLLLKAVNITEKLVCPWKYTGAKKKKGT